MVRQNELIMVFQNHILKKYPYFISGKRDEPKKSMRLTLCLGCGEYLCQPTANVDYCFEDHVCDVDKQDIEKFKKVIEIIQANITAPLNETKPSKEKKPNPEPEPLAEVQPATKSAPLPPPPPLLPKAQVQPAAGSILPKTSKEPKLQAKNLVSDKMKDSKYANFLDELKAKLLQKRTK